MTAIPPLPPRINAYVSLQALVCPRRHHVRRGHIPLEHGFYSCYAPAPTRGESCGLWLYLVIVRGGGALLTDVTADEAALLNDPRLTPDAIMRELRKRRNAA